MSDPKTVVWFGNSPQPSAFFFRSPFRSWKFAINTVLLVAVCLGYTFVVLKQPSFLLIAPTLTLLVLNVVYPYQWALKRHGKINELYRSGKIMEQSAESPLNEVLEVADNSMNEGLRNTSFVFGLFLLSILKWKLHYFK